MEKERHESDPLQAREIGTAAFLGGIWVSGGSEPAARVTPDMPGRLDFD